MQSEQITLTLTPAELECLLQNSQAVLQGYGDGEGRALVKSCWECFREHPEEDIHPAAEYTAYLKLWDAANKHEVRWSRTIREPGMAAIV